MTGSIYVGASEPTVLGDELAEERAEMVEELSEINDAAYAAREAASGLYTATLNGNLNGSALLLSELLDATEKLKGLLE
jgi:hypothetical protein